MGRQLPIRVPPSWFLTTSAVCSSSTLQPYCRLLPILGFSAFPPVAKQDSPRCTFCPSKLSLRRQRRVAERVRPPVGPRQRCVRCQTPRSPRTLPPRPFSSIFPALRLPAAPFRSKPDLEALLHRRVRCTLGCCQPLAPGAPLGLSDLPASGDPGCQTPACKGEVSEAVVHESSQRYVKDHSEK
jgi:hypothetical protein